MWHIGAKLETNPIPPAPIARSAFTLVELLIVVGIVTVLVALLLPVLSRARYLATLTNCMSNLRQVGLGLSAYANENHGKYPNRFVYNGNKPDVLAVAGYGDMRPTLKNYIDFDNLACPFAAQRLAYVENTTASDVEWTYSMWFSWYWTGGALSLPSNAPGIPVTYGNNSCYVLASDCIIDSPSGTANSMGSHPACGGESDYNTSSNYLTRYETSNFARPPCDVNFLYLDGSVRTYPQIQFRSTDPGLFFPNTFQYVGLAPWNTYLPLGQ